MINKESFKPDCVSVKNFKSAQKYFGEKRLKLFSELCNAYGVSGREGRIADIMAPVFKGLGYSVKTDKSGNVIASAPGTTGKREPLMLGAHMDEIGMLVRVIDNDGFIRFSKIGGIDDRTLLNQRVAIQTEKGDITGVIAPKPIHLVTMDEMKSTIKYTDLFIDIGAKGRKQAEKWGVEIANPVSFDIKLNYLGNNIVSGKAIDNRIGCFVLLDIAEKVKDKNVVLVGTVQEEVGCKGVKPAAFGLEPSAFIAVDTTIAGGIPEGKPHETVVKLDGGPSICVYEASGRGNIAPQWLVKALIKVAKDNRIKYQVEAIDGGATDAMGVFNVMTGVPCIAVDTPTRYIHSNMGIVPLEQVNESCRYMAQIVKALG